MPALLCSSCPLEPFDSTYLSINLWIRHNIITYFSDVHWKQTFYNKKEGSLTLGNTQTLTLIKVLNIITCGKRGEKRVLASAMLLVCSMLSVYLLCPLPYMCLCFDLSWAQWHSPDYNAYLITCIQSTHFLQYKSSALPCCLQQIVSSATEVVNLCCSLFPSVSYCSFSLHWVVCFSLYSK